MMMVVTNPDSALGSDRDGDDEEEVPTTTTSSLLPLLAFRNTTTSPPSSSSPSVSPRDRGHRRLPSSKSFSSSHRAADARRRLAAFAVGLGLLLFVLRANQEDDNGSSGSGLSSWLSSSSLSFLPGGSTSHTHPHPPFNASHWIGSLTDALQAAKAELIDKLRDDYGRDVADRLFSIDDDTNSTRGRSVFQPADVDDPVTAWSGFGRKVAIKLAQSAMSSPSPVRPTFIWATAGHSAAAGHGNLYNQSYTAVLEQRLQPFFQQLQLEFVGRNYAVGGASSGPEIALCLGPLLGHNDVDMVSWDYGMTDGSNYERLELFMVKAAQLPSRPVAVAFPRELDVDASRRHRRQVMAQLAHWGLPAFVQDEAEFQNNLRKHVPDTFGMTQAEIDHMSPYTRSFVCQGHIEEGDPYCNDEKFDMTACPDRRFRTSWHPGWKWHAYQGNLMAMFVVEAVENAVAMLRERVANQQDLDLTVLLDDLAKSERSDYQSVLGNVSATLPPYADRYHRPQRDSDDDDDDSTTTLDAADTDADADADDGSHWLRKTYYTSPNYCHIALLPSEIRYRGILDELPTPPIFANGSGVVANPVDFAPALVRNPWAAFRDDEYNKATVQYDTHDEMLLLGDPDTRQVDCPVPLNVDHQDFFFVSQLDGWRHVVLPTSREVRAYGGGDDDDDDGGGSRRPPALQLQLQGVVAICYVGCPWGKCMEPDKRWQLGSENVVDLQVNGVDVTNMREMGANSNCYVLEHENGYVWEPLRDHDPPSSSAGQFRISALVTGHPKYYVRFSSFLLW